MEVVSPLVFAISLFWTSSPMSAAIWTVATALSAPYLHFPAADPDRRQDYPSRDHRIGYGFQRDKRLDKWLLSNLGLGRIFSRIAYRSALSDRTGYFLCGNGDQHMGR